MSQMKAAILSAFVFAIIVIPFVLSVFIDSINQSGFIKVTTEVAEMVKAEGGVTPKVSNVTNALNKRGYSITFKNSDGISISGQQKAGTEIIMMSNYKYANVMQDQTLNTENSIRVLKRN